MANDGFEWMDQMTGSARNRPHAHTAPPRASSRREGDGEHLRALRAQIERLGRRVQELEHERDTASWSPPPRAAEVPVWAARLGVGIAVGLSALATAVQIARHGQGSAALRAGRALGALLAAPRTLLFG